MFNFVNSLHFIHFIEIILLIFDLISSSSTNNGPPNGADRKVEKIDAIVSDIWVESEREGGSEGEKKENKAKLNISFRY